MPPHKILLFNPNSTEGFTTAMTEHITKYYESNDDVHVRFGTAPVEAPASITSVTTSILSAASSLRNILSELEHENYDAIVIACFSAHPLVPMLREMTTVPVVGIMEAGILMASQVGSKPGIITTDKRWEPLLEHEIEGELGLSRQCRAGVMSSGLSVLELETLPWERVGAALGRAAARMVAEREADVILLGCAGMVGLDEVVQHHVGPDVTVIDPVVCAVETAVSLARMKLRTAKAGRYAMSTM
ncbi:hypothetical protein FFLO_00760 [Filobasidium floriforme]|uniref:Hydantoin racemase n=1 Tax=Filobasidium floriforme TaxID=5210 RepID=A0A8K0JVP5_9TREE|nr:hydantoin racemase [Filobasidium floriforme]KAG7571248.1 hypothetical protein FFLO_00760 [Filobasidium floriforme]KAH8085877.1 hydantoin racemase [Filobasidium floriforme]